MALTTRARVALLVAVAALLVAGTFGDGRLAAGSQQSSGDGTAAGRGGGADGVSECTAYVDRCDDTIEGPIDDPDECGVQAAGTGPAAVVSSGACHGGARLVDPGDGAQLVEPTPGMADVRPHIFDHAVVGDDGSSVTVSFWSGVEPCYVLDHVDVRYGTNTVTVTLFEGHDPDAQDAVCIEIAILKKVVIRLAEAVGDRRIVDGAV